MTHRTYWTPLVVGALLCVAFVTGTFHTNSDRDLAFAGAEWNPKLNAYVTGAGSDLTFWKVKGGRIIEAESYRLDRAAGASANAIRRTVFRPAKSLALPGATAKAPAKSKPSSGSSGAGKSCGGGGKSCGGSGKSCG